MTRPLALLLAAGFLCVAPPLLAGTFSHPLQGHPSDVRRGPKAFQSLPDTVDVLAVMVQFPPDTDVRTTGDGRFDTSSTTFANPPIDAPPRNAAYFADHLTFLGSYYAKASKGKVIIRSTLIPQVVTLSTVMGRYSPAKGGTNLPVAELARDSWRSVDSLGLVADFAKYQSFIVFHAGVGRDIDLVATLGYDPAPLDIPSLYLGEDAFSEFLGTPGIPVQGGAFMIPNTAILPETESREVPGVVGPVFLELGINGLLCASFGNFLGLPDLFNTNTGQTAIGRFGLMDGQSIFSFSGAFPPEPSAWEKYWLGWLQPHLVQPPGALVSLPAVSLADSVIRIPLAGGEYYLLENRNRDPQGNGQRVTMRYGGATTTMTFRVDTTGFNAFDISALQGTVIEVEDLDWSLPGGVDTDGTFYDGGMLLWHIDEQVISSGLATNTVNADPERRGVDLEEADGSQDIGAEFGAFTSGSGSENGTALDFWFAGNSSPVFKNSFSLSTFPASKSNSGAQSLLTISEFSPRGARMQCLISWGGADIRPLAGYPKQTGERLPDAPLLVVPPAVGDPPAVVVATTGEPVPSVTRSSPSEPALTSSKLYAWRLSGSSFLSGGMSSGLVDSGAGGNVAGGVSAKDLDGDGRDDILRSQPDAQGGSTSTLVGLSLDPGGDGLGRKIFAQSAGTALPTYPVFVARDADSLAAFGFRNLYVYGEGGFLVDSIVFGGTSVTGVSAAPAPYAFIITSREGTVTMTTRGRRDIPQMPDRVRDVAGVITGPSVVSSFSSGQGATTGIAFTTADGRLFVVDSTLAPFPGFPVGLGDSAAFSPALADVDGDGRRDIVAYSTTSVVVLNMLGVVLDGFPVKVHGTISSPPIVADVDGDASVDVIAATAEGSVYAFSRRGDVLPGFPLASGKGKQWPAVVADGDSLCLLVASAEDGTIAGWRTGRRPASITAAWPQYQGDIWRSGTDPIVLVSTPAQGPLFPPERAYNWPNPAYGGATNIRFYVREDATVNITVVDMAGDRVTTWTGYARAGLDNEFVWDISGVQSGIYFAHLQATGQTETGHAVIKIAVVK